MKTLKVLFAGLGLTDPVLKNLTEAIDQYKIDGIDGIEERNRENLLKLWREADLDEELAKVRAIKTAREYLN